MAINEDLDFKDIVGDVTLEQGGYAGSLLELALLHLKEARDNSQLTDEQVGEVYASTINNAFVQSIQFVMGERTTEIQADNLKKQGLILDEELVTAKLNQALISRQISQIEDGMRLAELARIDNELGTKVQRDQGRASIVQTERNISKIEQDIALSKIQSDDQLLNTAKDREAKSAQIVQTERTISKIEQDIELSANADERALTQLDDQLVTSATQRTQTERTIADIEKDIEVKERTTKLQEDSTTKDIESKTIQDSLVSRNIAIAEKDIEVKEQQIVGMANDNLVKEQQIESAKAQVVQLNRQIVKLEKDIDISERQMHEAELAGVKQRAKLDADIITSNRQTALIEAQTTEQMTDTGRKTNWSNKDLEVKDAEIARSARDTTLTEAKIATEFEVKTNHQYQQQALIAKTEDEHGRTINSVSCDPSNDTNTKHYQEVSSLTEKARADKYTVENIMPQQNNGLVADTYLKKAQRDTEVSKKELTERQRLGFDDNKKQKAVDKALDIWSIAYSSAPVKETIPVNFNGSTGAPNNGASQPTVGMWYEAAEYLSGAMANDCSVPTPIDTVITTGQAPVAVDVE